MPTLDTRGMMAAAQIAFYVPIAIISILLVFRYVFRRDAGWLFLFIFSASKSDEICIHAYDKLTCLLLARIAEGALTVAGEMAKIPNATLLNVAHIIDYVGVSALLLSLLGFIGMAYAVLGLRVPRIPLIYGLQRAAYL
jgi:hypothetical protein